MYQVVRANPRDYGWRRPTWTRELLVETLVRETGVRIHVTTMSRALALVVIEHHMDLIMSIADRIVMIDQGAVLAAGTPAEIQRDAGVREAYLGRDE